VTTLLVRSIVIFFFVFGAHSLAARADERATGASDVPAVPNNLQVPAGHSLFFAGHAIGTQNFICLSTKNKQDAEWRFTGPQATLFIADGNGVAQQATTHFLSSNPGESGLPRPTWQDSADTSAVWGRVVASSADAAYVAPGAIPWLLLQAAGAQLGPSGGAAMAQTTFIQRLNTTGGLAPATGCSGADDLGRVALVPYTADYFFYRAEQ